MQNRIQQSATAPVMPERSTAGHSADQRKPNASNRAGRALRVSDGRTIASSSSSFLLANPGKVALQQMNSLDWKAQLSDFLRKYGRTGTARFDRKASEETLRNRTDVLFKTMRLIMTDQRLQTLSQVKPRYMPRMMELWELEGVGARARINYFTHMRWFWRLCGIEIEPIKHFEKEEGEYTICRSATRDLSWKGNGVSFDEIYQLFLAEEPIAARMLQTIEQYGLRLKEAICLRPHESDRGDRLEITRGSKTGRARVLKFDAFDDENFRLVLDELKGQVCEDEHLAWSNRTLKQAKEHMHYLARKFGLTRKGLGVTPHGLRHDFAINQLEKLTGLTAPVRGGVAINYKQIVEVRLKISEAMGHGRPKATNAYYGNFMSQDRQQIRHFNASWLKLEPVTADIWTLLKSNGASNLYWIGNRALGFKSSDAQPFEFVFQPGLNPFVSAMLAPQVSELVLGATGCDCIVRPWEALPGAHQMIWENESVPVFTPVSPVALMEMRMEAQRAARFLTL